MPRFIFVPPWFPWIARSLFQSPRASRGRGIKTLSPCWWTKQLSAALLLACERSGRTRPGARRIRVPCGTLLGTAPSNRILYFAFSFLRVIARSLARYSRPARHGGLESVSPPARERQARCRIFRMSGSHVRPIPRRHTEVARDVYRRVSDSVHAGHWGRVNSHILSCQSSDSDGCCRIA